MAESLALRHANGMRLPDVLRLHAHLLAEKIREHGLGNDAADLIDEEV